MKKQIIDFVITWVDGSDPLWFRQKQNAKKKQGVSVDIDDRIERYRDWEILKYLFRSIENFAPWVNNVYFVTCGHLPAWLNTECPKLQIVSHKDFIPEKYLPTFNSHSIEWNFHRIKNLSEHFVYFNDDMFLLHPIKPTDFFENGKPVDMLALQPDVANVEDTIMPYIYLNNTMLLAKYFDKRENMKKQPGAYFHIGYPPMYFGYNLLEMAFPRFTGFYTVHGPSPLKKETYRFFWEKEEELLDGVCSHPFRHKDDVSQYVLREYQKLSGEFVPENVQKICGYYDAEQTNDRLVRSILRQKKKIICINDSNHEIDFEKVKKEINQAFEQIFPEKSSFENSI